MIKATSRFVDQILMISDVSTDNTTNTTNTTNIAKNVGANVIDNIVTRSWQDHQARGYAEAIKRGADIVVQIDADGQYDPEEIPKLIQPILDNKADLVLGTRLENLKYEMPWLE